jgi:hypothetical protein
VRKINFDTKDFGQMYIQTPDALQASATGGKMIRLCFYIYADYFWMYTPVKMVSFFKFSGLTHS